MRLIFFLSDSWHNETSSSPPPPKKNLSMTISITTCACDDILFGAVRLLYKYGRVRIQISERSLCNKSLRANLRSL